MFEFMIIGFKEFESKKGRDCYLVEFLLPYSEYQQELGSTGYSVQTKFLSKDAYKKLSEDSIGRMIEFKYETDNMGRTSVVDINIL